MAGEPPTTQGGSLTTRCAQSGQQVYVDEYRNKMVIRRCECDMRHEMWVDGSGYAVWPEHDTLVE